MAVVCAHEIGHALGMTHHWEKPPDDTVISVMNPIEYFGDEFDCYENHNIFRRWDAMNYQDTFPNGKSALNLRDVVGINTVDAGS